MEPGFDVAPGETPLAANLEPIQAAIVEHAVDCDPIYLQQLLQLLCGEQVIQSERFSVELDSILPLSRRHVKFNITCCNKI
jgi:hypothetical protein